MAKSGDTRLGRGLGALLDENLDVGVEDGTEFAVPLAELRPNPYQPRGAVADQALAELAASIEEHGLLQPLVVRPSGAHWQIVAGERRWRALKSIGRKSAPAVVRDLTNEQMLLVALVENLQREALTPLEEARSYQRLADEFGLTQEQIAGRVGRERSTVANAMRLLTLPASVQAILEAGGIHAGHARALLGLRREKEQLALARAIESNDLSVREAERRVRVARDAASDGGSRARKSASAPAVDPHVRRAQRALERAMGTEVSVRLTAEAAGEIRIVFHDASDFERLIGLMTGLSPNEL